MKTFIYYSEKAKKVLNLPSDYALSKLLGLKQPSIIAFKKGIARPSEETMLKLATLAKIDAREALIDLAIWRAEDKGFSDVKNVWKNISKMFSIIVCAVLLSFSTLFYTHSSMNKNRTDIDNHLSSNTNYATNMYRCIYTLPL